MLSENQSKLIAIDAVRGGVPASLVEKVLRIAGKAYLLGTADATIGLKYEGNRISMSLEQAALLALESVQSGMAMDYMPVVLSAADKGYALGYADKSMGLPQQEKNYSLDLSEIVEAATLQPMRRTRQ